MKKIIALILTALMIATVFAGCGEKDGTVDSNKTINSDYTVTRDNGTYKYDVYKSYIALVKYIGTETDVTIPEKIDDLPVTTINSKAFNTNTEDNKIVVKKVTIPASVQYIHSHAFYGCMDLEQITVADANTAFTAVDGVLFNKDKSKMYGFPIKSGKTEYAIPDGVTELHGSQFAFCTSLTKITIPSTVTLLGDYVFHGCTGLTEIAFPEGVKEVGSFLFLGCDNLATVTLPKTDIEGIDNALNGCESIKTIKGYSGSDAENVAKSFNAKFESIG